MRCAAYVHSTEHRQLWMPCTAPAANHGGKLALCTAHAEALLGLAFGFIDHGVHCVTIEDMQRFGLCVRAEIRDDEGPKDSS